MDGSGKGEGAVPSSSEQVIKDFWGPKASQWGGVISRSCIFLKIESYRNYTEPERSGRSRCCNSGAANG